MGHVGRRNRRVRATLCKDACRGSEGGSGEPTREEQKVEVGAIRLMLGGCIRRYRTLSFAA